MQEGYTLTVDLLADAIAEAVGLDVEHREHYVELSRFANDMPTNPSEKERFLNSLVNAVKRSIITNSDVYLTKDENDQDIIYIKEL